MRATLPGRDARDAVWTVVWPIARNVVAPRIYIVYIQRVSGGDDDDDFLALLDAYLDEPYDPNPALGNVRILWIEDDPRVGALHIAGHGISKYEVEQVLFEIPPVVQAKRSRDDPDRTLFWGATRRDRWLFVVCEDWAEGTVRYLKPITAFEPDDGERYWRTR
jgi:hypothetical protein